MRKGYALALKKGVSCPDCGQRVVLPPEMPEGGLKARFECGKCEWVGTILETMEFGQMPESPLEERPVGSRITRRGDRWVIPGTGRMNGEWFFALIWLGFVTTFAVMLLFHAEGGPGWMGLLFLVPFFAVGFWILYLACRATFRETEVRINLTDVRVTKRLFGVMKEERIVIDEIEGVEFEQVRDGEAGSSVDLVLKRRDGKDLKVGLEVSMDEKRWLLGEWREKLGVNEVIEAGEETAFDFEGKAIQVRGLELEPMENGYFLLTVRNRVALWVVLAGVLMTIVGGGMTAGVITGGDWGENDGPAFFRWVDLAFLGVGMVFGLIPLLAGIGGLVWGVRKVGEVKKYAFYPDRVEFATVQRGGRISRSGSLRRESVKSVVMTRTGDSNGESRYRVQLRASENLTLLWFYPLEVAEEVAGWVRQWIEAD